MRPHVSVRRPLHLHGRRPTPPVVRHILGTAKAAAAAAAAALGEQVLKAAAWPLGWAAAATAAAATAAVATSGPANPLDELLEVGLEGLTRGHAGVRAGVPSRRAQLRVGAGGEKGGRPMGPQQCLRRRQAAGEGSQEATNEGVGLRSVLDSRARARKQEGRGRLRRRPLAADRGGEGGATHEVATSAELACHAKLSDQVEGRRRIGVQREAA
jgi:hypothetical protein